MLHEFHVTFVINAIKINKINKNTAAVCDCCHWRAPKFNLFKVDLCGIFKYKDKCLIKVPVNPQTQTKCCTLDFILLFQVFSILCEAKLSRFSLSKLCSSKKNKTKNQGFGLLTEAALNGSDICSGCLQDASLWRLFSASAGRIKAGRSRTRCRVLKSPICSGNALGSHLLQKLTHLQEMRAFLICTGREEGRLRMREKFAGPSANSETDTEISKLR